MTRSVFYIECSPDPVLAHLHEPEADGMGAAVLILPAFGWEEVASAPIRRRWADQLAAEGLPALRIDLPGTGDSGGKPSDPGRVTAWIGAVRDGAAALRSGYPQSRIVALGFGLGGLLAWVATAEGAVIDDLALWGVPSRGRVLLRELHAFAALERDGAETAPPMGFAPGGFLVSKETERDLAAIDLTELPLRRAPARRLLLLSRDGLPADERLRKFADSLGLPATEASGPGWGAMMSGPHESVLPNEVVALLSKWIGLGPVGPIGAPARMGVAHVLSGAGARERPWTTRSGGRDRFGVLAEPLSAGPRMLGVLLLSGEVSHGPNRMWVEFARRWAPRGVPVARLEVEEDEPVDLDDRPYAREKKLYDHRYAVRTSEAIADLVRDGVADRWLVVGLCAGASWAFHAALRNPLQVSAAVLINPFVFDWEDEVAVAATLGRARRRGLDSWKRLAAGQFDVARVGAVAAHAARTPIEWRRRRRRTSARIERELRYLDRLRAAKTQLTFLVGQDEPFMDRIDEEGLLGRLLRWPNVNLERLPGRDHSFRALDLQALVHRKLDEAVAAELERLPSPLLASRGRMSRPQFLAKSDLLR
jgi:dienelactone hydrolase